MWRNLAWNVIHLSGLSCDTILLQLVPPEKILLLVAAHVDQFHFGKLENCRWCHIVSVDASFVF